MDPQRIQPGETPEQFANRVKVQLMTHTHTHTHTQSLFNLLSLLHLFTHIFSDPTYSISF
jgi:hypothetical protein